ncbi:ABC transporter permease subunit [Actinorugispora endophytica]|uniref:ABC-2 type transport system permease protein n=1 Tax=Actinorugispora endophytica TaxID=1605990 RepID=A0A4R6V4A2_9ACTN|nr:ABC transporter permease subunit [Actinorugispora endophytica]TDQ53682.1 ABC-2 type transport system permease protein [Actinorugispora endophytica]
MRSSVFTRFLRDNLRALVGWTVGVAAVTALYGSFWPSMSEAGDAMDAYVESLPEGFMESMGWTSLSTVDGYLNATVFGLLVPVLLVIAAVSLGSRAIAGDEEAGALELLMAHPVTRVGVVLQRAAASAVFLAVPGLTVFGTLALLGPAIDVDIPLDRLLAASTGVTLIALVHGAVALAVGAATGRRAVALGAAAVLAVVGYLGNTFARQVEELEWLRFGSAFHYAMAPDPLVNGFDAGATAVPAAAAAVLTAIAAAAFDRRDIGV